MKGEPLQLNWVEDYSFSLEPIDREKQTYLFKIFIILFLLCFIGVLIVILNANLKKAVEQKKYRTISLPVEVVGREPVRTVPLPAMDLPMNEHIQSFIIYYSRLDRYSFVKSVERLKHYYPLFMKNAVKHNLPLEIAALGIVESRLKTSALSHKGALGIWQLMPRTAEVLGLEVSSLSDERTNAAKSTDAAFRHIRNLYEYFRGDWSLTLASYNAGISYVARTAKKYGIQDFWDFYKIPEFKKETLHYVPRIYAVAHILRNPKKYGISSPLVF